MNPHHYYREDGYGKSVYSCMCRTYHCYCQEARRRARAAEERKCREEEELANRKQLLGGLLIVEAKIARVKDALINGYITVEQATLQLQREGVEVK